MRNFIYHSGATVLLVTLLVIGACAGSQEMVKVTEGVETEKKVDMRAINFKFEPSVIQARKGDTISLEITNTASSEHNFTIKNPGGRIMKTVDLLADQTKTVKVSLEEPGNYEFYCNKPFHPTLGMKGHFEVIR